MALDRPPLTSEQLLTYLDQLGLDTATVAHEAVFTVEEAARVRHLPGAHCKSLFLRNKKGRMWLVTCRADRKVDLRRLAESLGAGRLGFASPERLARYLGVTPGAVSPFGVINDVDGEVTVVFERSLLDEEPINLHPLDNTMTTAIGRGDLLRFLDAVGHPPLLLAADEL